MRVFPKRATERTGALTQSFGSHCRDELVQSRCFSVFSRTREGIDRCPESIAYQIDELPDFNPPPLAVRSLTEIVDACSSVVGLKSLSGVHQGRCSATSDLLSMTSAAFNLLT